jgi:hypothetical protein
MTQNPPNGQQRSSPSPEHPVMKKEPKRKIKKEIVEDESEVIDISDDDMTTISSAFRSKKRGRPSEDDIQIVKVCSNSRCTLTIPAPFNLNVTPGH